MSRSIDFKTQLWTKRFREFEASSLTVDQYCQSVGCSCATFYLWRRKLAGASLANSTRSVPTSKPTAVKASAFLKVQSKSDCNSKTGAWHLS